MSKSKNDVPEALLVNLLTNCKKSKGLIGEDGLLEHLTKLVFERALEAEITERLGHGKNQPVAKQSGKTCSGKSCKMLKSELGKLPIDVPRDQHGSFKPQLVIKHQTRWASFDDKILSLYACGMTAREIRTHLE